MSETTTPALQFYDPHRLVVEVIELLERQGRRPAFPDGRQIPAAGAAGSLLRALGIQPGVDAETHYKGSLEQIWSENQDV